MTALLNPPADPAHVISIFSRGNTMTRVRPKPLPLPLKSLAPPSFRASDHNDIIYISLSESESAAFFGLAGGPGGVNLRRALRDHSRLSYRNGSAPMVEFT